MRKHVWSLIAVLVMIVIAFGSSDGGNGGGRSSSPSSAPARVKTAAELHQEQIEQQFSAWDGSHRGLTNAIKQSMHNPDSYDHVKTIYIDGGDYLIVVTEFRGTNAFGGIVTNTVTAKVDLYGNVLEIIPESAAVAAAVAARLNRMKQLHTAAGETRGEKGVSIDSGTSESNVAVIGSAQGEPETNDEDVRDDGLKDDIGDSPPLDSRQDEPLIEADPEHPIRLWTSASGKHTTEAKIVSYGNGVVTLENRDGKRMKVPVDKLSEDDQEYVRNWRKARR